MFDYLMLKLIFTTIIHVLNILESLVVFIFCILYVVLYIHV